MQQKSSFRSRKTQKEIGETLLLSGGFKSTLFSVLLIVLLQMNTRAQDVTSFRDSLSFRTLQDTFCSCVNRHAGEKSEDWGDAVALAFFLKLDQHTQEFRSAEILLRHRFPKASMRKLDHLIDSLLVSDGFGKCVSLWPVNLNDKSGFFKTLFSMRQHPPFLQLQTVHMREQTGQALLNYLHNGVSDSIAILFDRQATFDSIRPALETLRSETKGKLVTMEMKFERIGRDSSGLAKMKLLQNGLHDLGGIRITYRKDDPYAKIERIGMLLRDTYGNEQLLDPPAPSPVILPKPRK
jgi:hypothetical protein